MWRRGKLLYTTDSSLVLSSDDEQNSLQRTTMMMPSVTIKVFNCNSILHFRHTVGP